VERLGKDSQVRRICLFAGTSEGVRPAYKKAAQGLGDELAARHIGLVYGGASIGLMGAVADTILEAGGEAIGVLPRGLFLREVAHPRLTALHEVGSMHERKALMSELADGFIALPGGYGTFDELFEIVTWAQLGIHQKPIGLLNVDGYFGPLLALVDHACREGFIPQPQTSLLLHAEDPATLLDCMARGGEPAAARWTTPREPLPEP
jgi:uncharacterized protein (TIGR00730 family)